MKSWQKKRKKKRGRATRNRLKSMPRRNRIMVTAAMLDTLKEKQPQQPTPSKSLTERLLAHMRRFKGSATMPENTVIHVINAMMADRGYDKMSPDVESLVRVAYRNA